MCRRIVCREKVAAEAKEAARQEAIRIKLQQEKEKREREEKLRKAKLAAKITRYTHKLTNFIPDILVLRAAESLGFIRAVSCPDPVTVQNHRLMVMREEKLKQKKHIENQDNARKIRLQEISSKTLWRSFRDAFLSVSKIGLIVEFWKVLPSVD